MTATTHQSAKPRPGRLALVLVALACCTPLADAADFASLDSPRVLIDRALQRRVVTQLAIDEQAVRYRDALGRPGTLPRAELLAIAPPDAHESAQARRDARPTKPLPAPNVFDGIVWRELGEAKSSDRARVRLVDGQLYTGGVKDAPPLPDTLAWSHPALGTLNLPLERVSSITLAAAPAAPRPESDTLLLANGDSMSGFVQSVSRESFLIEVGGKPSTIAADRVVAARFANPAAPAVGSRLWLRDGSNVAISSFATRGDQLSIIYADPAGGSPPAPDSQAHARTLEIPLADTLALSVDAGSLRALAEFAPRVISLGAGRVHAPAPIVGPFDAVPLNAADVEIPGPMTVEWTLPAGVTRLAGVAELPLSCRAFGDCVVTITLDSSETPILRERLNATRPSVEFSARASTTAPAALRLTIDAGDTGPIQDRVTLRRVLILLGK